MEKEVTERRIQVRGRSFVVTIPREIVRKAGLCKGQGVRFVARDGEIVMRPTSAGTTDGSGAADHGAYEKAVADMMSKGGRPKKPEGSGTASASPEKGRLEKLRLK